MIPHRWVGIDEAGYGPNLGPLVMSAVVAEGPGDRAPDLWGDLPDRIARAGARDDRLWVDDSKAIFRGGQGLERLERAALALFRAAGGPLPATIGELCEALGAGGLEAVELAPHWWGGVDPPWPGEPYEPGRPFDGAPWRIAAVRSVVVGPARFNDELGRCGSKADVHFAAFGRLLCRFWDESSDWPTWVCGDKHGGRHFYGERLARVLTGAAVEPLAEGPALSQYLAQAPGRRLEIALRPRADAGDGLVALASMVSKLVRERWMGVFNAHWAGHVAGLRPTAGYPLDAARFRADIEPACARLGLATNLWWRAK